MFQVCNRTILAILCLLALNVERSVAQQADGVWLVPPGLKDFLPLFPNTCTAILVNGQQAKMSVVVGKGLKRDVQEVQATYIFQIGEPKWDSRPSPAGAQGLVTLPYVLWFRPKPDVAPVAIARATVDRMFAAKRIQTAFFQAGPTIAMGETPQEALMAVIRGLSVAPVYDLTGELSQTVVNIKGVHADYGASPVIDYWVYPVIASGASVRIPFHNRFPVRVTLNCQLRPSPRLGVGENAVDITDPIVLAAGERRDINVTLPVPVQPNTRLWLSLRFMALGE